jgi:hypothetical protein
MQSIEEVGRDPVTISPNEEKLWGPLESWVFEVSH